MSSTLVEPAPAVDELPGGAEFQYRPLSILAVVVFVLGLFSAAFSLLWFLLIVPVVNTCLGLAALMRIRASGGELGGRKLATCGLTLSAISLAAGIGYQWWAYQFEIPSGYMRISFSKDVSDRAKGLAMGRFEVEPELMALVGKKIFLKGFMYPSGQQTGLTSFLLVKDAGVCCFGKEPALNDMIGVYMRGAKTADYHSGRVSVAGTFQLNPQYKGASKLEPMFVIEGVMVSRSRSDFDPLQELDVRLPAQQEGLSPQA